MHGCASKRLASTGQLPNADQAQDRSIGCALISRFVCHSGLLACSPSCSRMALRRGSSYRLRFLCVCAQRRSTTMRKRHLPVQELRIGHGVMDHDFSTGLPSIGFFDRSFLLLNTIASHRGVHSGAITQF